MTPHEINIFPQDLKLVVRRQDGCAIVTVSGELDIASGYALRERLLGVLGTQGSRLVADLSGVTFCDASGLSALTAASRRARLLGGGLCLAAPSAPVAQVLRLSRAGSPRLETCATVHDAIRRLTQADMPGTVSSRPLPVGLPATQLPSRLVPPPPPATAGDANVRGAVAAVLAVTAGVVQPPAGIRPGVPATPRRMPTRESTVRLAIGPRLKGA